jgi:hypothetical protein
MNQRTLLDRLLSPAGFGLVLLLFLLPFVTVSCGVDNDKISANFTGVDLLVGGPPDITGHDVDADAAAQLVAVFENDYQVEPLAIVAAGLVFVGMLLALIPVARIRAWASAGAAAVSLLVLGVVVFLRAPSHVDAAMDHFKAATNIEEDVNAATAGAYGFWLAVVLLAGLGVWNGFQAVRTDRPDADDGDGPPPPDIGYAAQPAAPAPESWPSTSG